MNQEVLEIDGSHGEGGGQILRTSLSLSAITGRPLHITNIRASRRKPGLAAQHLTSVRAASVICEAGMTGDFLESKELFFRPTSPVKSGNYKFDVAHARQGGSAGSVTMIFQTVFLPLLFTSGVSHVIIQGGTHVPNSPPYEYLKNVFLWTLTKMEVTVDLDIECSGWYPQGEGKISAIFTGRNAKRLKPFSALCRPELKQLQEYALTTNVNPTVSPRMLDAAQLELAQHGIRGTKIDAVYPGRGHGACFLLFPIYSNADAELHCGFDAYGERGKLAETVSKEAVDKFIDFHLSSAVLDTHLGDQLLLPAVFADGETSFITKISKHLLTNAWVIEKFNLAEINIGGKEHEIGKITVRPRLDVIFNQG